jgi:hypothetical protein
MSAGGIPGIVRVPWVFDRYATMSEWLKLMLEEIARKEAERECARSEQALREQEQALVRNARAQPKRGARTAPARDSR